MELSKDKVTTTTTDAMLPAHERRTGRIGSLHEFQQRAARYDGRSVNDASTDEKILISALLRDENHSNPSDTYIEVAAPHDRRGSDGSDFLEAFRKYGGRRSISSVSLFGGERSRSLDKRTYYRRQLKAVSFLILLGVIGGPLNYGIRVLYNYLIDLREYVVDQAPTYASKLAAWTAHTVVFSGLGLFFTQLAPVAAGSGVSQMKSILTGIDPRMYLPGYFDFSTFLAKVAGLVCSVGAGLIVGTEGAYVHIMSIVTHHLLKTPMFKGFSAHLNGRLQLLAAACAVGVSSLFSSPIGGVLFSMEVTSTYYLMSNYIKAFISSVAGAIMLRLTLVLAKSESNLATQAVLKTQFPASPFSIWEMPLYVLLGAVLGLLCAAMMWFVRVIAERRSAFRKSSQAWKKTLVTWIDPLVVSILTAVLTFVPGAYARHNSMDDLAILFTEGELPSTWQVVSKYYALSVLSAVFMFLLPLCITLKIPTGIWVPTFIAGAAFGRMFGEIAATIFPSLDVIPGTYALAGAAAFGSAATRAISVAVITLEITAAMSMILPLFCSSLAAMAVSNLFKEKSVYDTLLVVSGMPFLPLVDFEPTMTTSDIAEPCLVYITKRTTIARILLALQRLPHHEIPVVDNEATMILLGVVSGSQLRRFVRKHYELNGIGGVDEDLGEKPQRDTQLLSWATLKDKLTLNTRTDNTGGFNGMGSVDITYNALSTQKPHVLGAGVGAVPFLLDDSKMLGLLNEGWDSAKAEKLNATVKITQGRLCVIRPMAMTISSNTPLDDLHMIFTMLRCDHCFVCDQGALEGVVTTKGLLRSGKFAGAA
ncbi:Dipeptidyl peptidase 2 [Phytophthora pseudosyringae]|uniref:Dipeptidyl peptidase 2 n=1 Tax=Phytophthora pseudosyringae TaxID=221518 RepID=A0A8T1VMV3_9STRA|nr:Dipeptidyl peptidase 2 [Phytophthora pseudosyringae]